MSSPKTLVEAVQHFSDLGVCHAYMVALKWPDGKIICPKCGGDKVGNIASRRMLQCKAKDCRKQFSAKVGTIFEDSPLDLCKWFVAVWCAANFKMGISSHELGRTLDVTQKTAWFMLHRIRLAMQTGTFRKLSGVVETDETFIGGRAENMNMPQCRGCFRYSAKALCHRCTLEARARKAIQYKLQRQRELTACG